MTECKKAIGEMRARYFLFLLPSAFNLIRRLQSSPYCSYCLRGCFLVSKCAWLYSAFQRFMTARFAARRQSRPARRPNLQSARFHRRPAAPQAQRAHFFNLMHETEGARARNFPDIRCMGEIHFKLLARPVDGGMRK